MTITDTRATGADDDMLDDAGRDSFPASDPPTWWAGRDDRPVREEGAP